MGNVLFTRVWNEKMSNKYIRSTDLDRFSRLQRLLRRNPHLSFPQQLLGEVGDVSTGDGDVLDAAADDVAFSLEHKHVKFCENKEGAGQQSQNKKILNTYHGDDVRDSIPAVDDGSRQRPLSDLSGCPGGSQRQDSLREEVRLLYKENMNRQQLLRIALDFKNTNDDTVQESSRGGYFKTDVKL